MSLTNVILGRRLANSEKNEQKIGVLAGVPCLGLDGLSSAAYGPEAALAVLVLMGSPGVKYLTPIIIGIVVLLILLYLSYLQTMGAYPNNGGSYTVAKANLGVNASLLAAAALMLDYILTVAVGISAGVGALVSAIPALHPYMLTICLAVLVLITFVSLRGTPESGWAFAIPTYLFLVSLGGVLALGIWRAVLAGGHPVAVTPVAPAPDAVEAFSLWTLMRAFASGCTAMTGVEAVSNGVSAFREPTVRNARLTLTVIVAALAVLLLGVGYLASAYQVPALDQSMPGYQTVVAQIVAAVVGRHALYYVALGSLLSVLCLSANTSFVDFPRLCHLVAQDGFLPEGFALAGRRLIYTVGVLFLTCLAGILLVVFGGITNRLVPLYAVGAFLAFTLSQAGMVLHGLHGVGQDTGRVVRYGAIAVNSVGTIATGVALVVILIAKFTEGAWLTVLAIPAVVVGFKAVKAYNDRIRKDTETTRPLNVKENATPIVVIPVRGLNRKVYKALRLAMRLSSEVNTIHLSSLSGDEAEDEENRLREQWHMEVEEPASQAGVPIPRLHVIESTQREFEMPVVRFVQSIQSEHPQRDVMVMVCEIVKTHWWQYLLHSRRVVHLERALVQECGRRVVVATVPWHLDPC